MYCVGCIHPPVVVEPWLLLACPRSATTCVLSGSYRVSYKVIYRWLLLVLGLEVPRRGQEVNQSWLLLVPDLGPLSERYRACWSQMLLVWENLEKSEAWAKTSHLYGKATGNNFVGLEFGRGGALGNHRGGVNSVSQVDGVSDMTCWLCVVRAQKRNSSLWQHFCLGESCPAALALMPDNSLPPHMSLMLFNLRPRCWSSEGMNLSKCVHS